MTYHRIQILPYRNALEVMKGNFLSMRDLTGLVNNVKNPQSCHKRYNGYILYKPDHVSTGQTPHCQTVSFLLTYIGL